MRGHENDNSPLVFQAFIINRLEHHQVDFTPMESMMFLARIMPIGYGDIPAN